MYRDEVLDLQDLELAQGFNENEPFISTVTVVCIAITISALSVACIVFR